jgi:hypothetical protein
MEIIVQGAILKSDLSKIPIWLWSSASLGILWNAFGVYQFIGSFRQTITSLKETGMTEVQAEMYLGLPTWISVVFAIGVFCGFLGSVALAARRKVATRIFALSLFGYMLLFAGDTYYGVFAAIPSQLAILASVVVIAIALLIVSIRASRRNLLQ